MNEECTQLLGMAEIITMQRAIDAEYGTFEDEVHELYAYDESAITDVAFLTPHAGVYSYETGGGVMFDWVLSYDLEEED